MGMRPRVSSSCLALDLRGRGGRGRDKGDGVGGKRRREWAEQEEGEGRGAAMLVGGRGEGDGGCVKKRGALPALDLPVDVVADEVRDDQGEDGHGGAVLGLRGEGAGEGA